MSTDQNKIHMTVFGVHFQLPNFIRVCSVMSVMHGMGLRWTDQRGWWAYGQVY